MSAPETAASPKRWLGLVKVLFGLVVLGLVARYFVPWRDHAILLDGEQSVEVPGTIEGDWKQEAIVFTVDQPDDLPESLRPTTTTDGARLSLTRKEGADWRPGLLRVFRELDASGLVLAFACLCAGLVFTVVRWWRLLVAAGCPTSLFASARLTLLGMFFNLVVPGLTGGDLIKAVLVAREHPTKRTEAVISVFVDRVIGIWVLAVIAAVGIVIVGDAFAALRWPVLIGVIGVTVALVLYLLLAPIRRLILNALPTRFPLIATLRRVDQAIAVYSQRPGTMLLALALSIGNHVSVIAAVLTIGRAFHDTMPTFNYLAVVPVANIASAVPISPAGWGVGELVFGALFEMLGGNAALGIATSVTFRLLLMVFGLAGGIFLLLPGGKVDLARVEREAASA